MKEDPTNFIMMPVPASMFTAVCALIGGVPLAGITVHAPLADPVMPELKAKPANVETAAAPAAATEAPVDTGEIDAAGWPWSPDLHASTKGMTKDGLWRMKVGVTRPDPKPGFPKTTDGGTGTAASGAASTLAGTATTATAGPATEEDDEFAMFRAASEKSDASDKVAAASVPARKWSDADLGKLCNQAAVKLGDPAPIKEIINDFVPEGETKHSRNVPAADREAFAQAIEKAAGIKFEG